MENIIATHKDGKIFVQEPSGAIFELVPYRQTPDGPQQIFGLESELDRIALCITDLQPVPTETIKKGFAQRTMAMLAWSTETVKKVGKALEAVNAKSTSGTSISQEGTAADDVQGVPAPSP